MEAEVEGMMELVVMVKAVVVEGVARGEKDGVVVEVDLMEMVEGLRLRMEGARGEVGVKLKGARIMETTVEGVEVKVEGMKEKVMTQEKQVVEGVLLLEQEEVVVVAAVQAKEVVVAGKSPQQVVVKDLMVGAETQERMETVG